jgi:sodium transport system permease protein
MVFLSSVLIGPLVLIGLTYFISSIEEKSEKREVYVHGAAYSPQIENFLARQDIKILQPPADFRALIKQGKHDAVLVIPNDFDKKFLSGDAEVELVYDDTRSDSSSTTIGVLRRLMRGFNTELATQRLIAHGVSPNVIKGVEIQNTNLGTAAQRAAMLLFMIPWMALMVSVSGSLAVAIDMTAGERERGSLEPLLLNPVRRLELILGKWSAVALYSIAIVVLILVGFAITLGVAPMPKLATLVSLSAAQYLLFLVMLIPFTLAMGALLMTIATFGRTFKEAQTYSSYVILVASLIPTVAIFAQLKDATWQLFVPMLGQLMVLTRILRGDPIDAGHLLIPFVVSVAIIAGTLFALSRLLKKEKIIFGRS